MLKAILWKEFREVLPWLVVAVAAQMMVLGLTLGIWRRESHRISYNDVVSLFPLFYLIAVLLPIAVGALQNSRERQQNTLQFVLNRPLRRESLYSLKLLLGGTACFVVGVGPLVALAAWTDRLPQVAANERWLVLASLKMASGMLLFYLGAFLSTLRRARWYGSGFFPLLAGASLFIVLQGIPSDLPYFRLAAILAGPVIAGIYVFTILQFVRTQDLL